MIFRRRLACSFCGKGATEVAKLVAGPRVYICNECVDIAKQIIDTSTAGSRTDPQVPMFVRRIASTWRKFIGSRRTWRLQADRRFA